MLGYIAHHLSELGDRINEDFELILASKYGFLFPTLAIGLLMIAVASLDDRLRDALDTRMREQRRR